MRSGFFFFSIFSAIPFSFAGFQPVFPYGSEKVRGVNLGGWLVLEPWITPSIFTQTGDPRIVDEFTLGQFQNHANLTPILQQHWDTFITEADFAAISGAGLNHVRIPIGFWAFEVSGGEPYVQGQLPFLKQAVTWAENHGLKVIIDLHGVPGSQNGFDNSGQRKSFPGWQTDPNNIARTNAVLKQIVAMFQPQSDTVTIIEAMNEPAGFDGDVILTPLTQYYFDSYGNIRFPFGTPQESNTVVMLHDAFQPLSTYSNMFQPPGFEGVMLDTHIYQIFSDEMNAFSNQQHIQTACNTNLDTTLWTVVGEWTPAMTDCATFLNGRGVGSRFDGSFAGSPFVGTCVGQTGPAFSFSPAFKTFLRQMWEAQVITYEKRNQGWLMWTWTTESADEWSYKAGLANGWIPQDPTDFQFPNICD